MVFDNIMERHFETFNSEYDKRLKEEKEIKIKNNYTETKTIDDTTLLIYDNLIDSISFDDINEVRVRLKKYINDDIRIGKIKESYKILVCHFSYIKYNINTRDIILSRVLNMEEIIIAEGRYDFFDT